MRLLIIGAGAMGSFLGARLALAGHDLTLVGRQPLVDAVRSRGLVLTDRGISHSAPARAFASLERALGDDEDYHLALLTVKSYDTSHLAGELAGLRARLPVLVTLQNGVGNEEVVADAIGSRRIIAGAIDTPVSSPSPGQVVVHRKRFKLGLAALSGETATVRGAGAMFAGAGFTVQVFADYRSLKWTKLLMNLLANASCALLDWSPSEVMAHPLASRLEAIAWQEALSVMRALHIQPVNLAGYPFRVLAPLARQLPPEWLAFGLRGFVAGGRGTKKPSLHIALSQGGISEVAWLNGAVARYGATLGIPTPVNRAFSELLDAVSTGVRPWDDLRGRPDRVAGYVDVESAV